MSCEQNIESLRSIIYQKLDHLITGNFCLLDYPNHSNIGDHLIWQGELAFLKRLQYQCNYMSSYAFFNKNKVKKNDLILLHGGGNFGDLYRPLQDFRLKIIREFPSQRIILFPQTVFYRNEELFKQDLEILNSHEDLTICVRDTKSYNLLKSKNCKFNLLLLPDMAFCLYFNDRIPQNQIHKKLFLKRTDNELALQNAFQLNIGVHDVFDWPTYHNNLANAFWNLVSFLSHKLSKYQIFRYWANSKTGFFPEIVRHNYVNTGIKFVEKYGEVYTDRLHGCIIAILLNKKVVLLDNSYGKNREFYNTWLRDFENVSLLIN